MNMSWTEIFVPRGKGKNAGWRGSAVSCMTMLPWWCEESGFREEGRGGGTSMRSGDGKA